MSTPAHDTFRSFQPQCGIVLGSGLGSFVERLAVRAELPFSEVPELPPSRVAGHAGRFILGELAGQKLLVMQGRVHLYEGHSAVAVTAGVRFMGASGVRRLVLTNAAGTLNELHPPGSWMMLADHLNLTGTSPLLGAPSFIDMSEVYSRRLRALFGEAASEMAMPLPEGVYAGLLGPQYETPAEVRMLATLGADAVGMSTVLEAIQAQALGIEVAAFSCLTNWAAGMSPLPLSHAEVLETGRAAAETFCRLMERALHKASV